MKRGESCRSHGFGLGLLKRALPLRILAGLDSILQRSRWAISPSIFLELRLPGAPANRAVSSLADPLEILRCPQSGTPLRREGDVLFSESGTRWGIRDGVYDFRRALD